MVLAYFQEAGYMIFRSAEHRFLISLGHHEYEAQNFVDEECADIRSGGTDVEPPRA